MIKSIKLFKENSTLNLEFTKIHEHKIQIDSSFLGNLSTTLHIEFEIPISKFRTHDYKWNSIDKRQFANWYASKLIILENNQLVQSSQHSGVWEVHSKNPNILLWHFNVSNSQPLVRYDSNHSKHIQHSVFGDSLSIPLAILFPKNEGIEISRSKIPFSAIICFTDHCDFDTLLSLKQQRQFFKTYDIKITKGFFLYKFSKRAKTACFESDEEELNEWRKDGHELAYHSLSQSIKPLNDSIIDFKTFEPPFKDVTTWIDHGFQPYNVSRYENYEALKKDYGSLLKDKGVNILWNYVDSGTAVNGVVNQLNPTHFTLNSYCKGIRNLGFRQQMPMIIKNIIFHYYNTDYSTGLYRDLAKYVKTFSLKIPIKKHLHFFINLLKLLRLITPVVLFWRARRHKIYPLANYTPVIFKHAISDKTFTVFQTLEMVDFKLGLNPSNLDLLIRENGLFIAHTYFSVPLAYHVGKLFKNQSKIDKQVTANFKYLSRKIKSEEIWNPTLHELICYFKDFQSVSFECNATGDIIIIDENQLEFRKVK